MLVSSSRALMRSPADPPARPDDGEAATADDTLRSEDDDEDQDDAVDDVAIGGKLAHDLGQGSEENCPHDGAEHVGRPANDGEGEDLDGAGDAVLRGVDEEIDVGFQAARVPGEYGADDERDHLVERNVDPIARGGQLVLSNRGPGLAEPGAGEPPHDVGEDRQGDQDGHDAAQRVGAGILEALAFAGDRHIEDEAQAQRFNEADRGDRQEDAAQSQHRQADRNADQAGQQGADEHIQRERRGQIQAHDDGGVGANRHETGVGQRQLAGVEGHEDRDGEDGGDTDLGNQQPVLGVESDPGGEAVNEENQGDP